ncbi:MAG: TIGR00282 family metallophosphoesterase [Spirochaetales bacterium]|nr:TIGR00282 family metallophosphoesterase [Spirochaetales bacterium]
MADAVTILIFGDLIGQPGCRALFVGLKGLIRKHNADFVVVNGENAAAGFGLTPELADQIFATGVDVITSGNHIWQKKEIYKYLDKTERVLRPANYPPDVPGKGCCVVTKRDFRLCVVNLQGLVDMYNLSSPFDTALSILRSQKGQCDGTVVDFHAESTAEKEALAIYLDGKVNAVVGTHTHVQTADERILPGGTAYITDLGMSGPTGSVIGVDPEASIRRNLSQMPLKMEVLEMPGVIRGVSVDISREGKTLGIKRIEEYPGF